MSEKQKPSKDTKEGKKGWFEKGAKFGRDFNLVVGSVALAGAFIAPPVLAVGLGVYAGVNYAQAGGFEAARRFSRNRDKKKQSKKSGK